MIKGFELKRNYMLAVLIKPAVAVHEFMIKIVFTFHYAIFIEANSKYY